ncbi:hypothetical protein R3P38DRAFT_2793887 [Favolaschia claudopus]|uniref:Uncharacterized protein n=1 Tax=Favolaschia claudopus TaxID=2862362 RepID=A0AAW0AB99_9AGAR
MATSSDSDPLFPLYSRAARQNCAAGYYDSPEVYSGMRFELRRIPTVYSRVVKQKEKKWELWSPNSSQTPFLPGWRIPGSLPTLPKLLEDRRYDGHVGRMDCLFSPHYFGEDVPHWPFIRRQHMVLSNDFAYAAYEPLMNQWAVDRDDRRMGRFRPEYVERLSALRRELDERMEEIKARLRSGSTTWSSRPQYATPTVITELLGTRFWWDAVDRGMGVQRGLREKEAWLTMMHARRSLGQMTMEQLRGIEFPPADERFMGVWVTGNGLLVEGAVLCNLCAGLPCFIPTLYPTTVRSDFVTGTDVASEVADGPYQRLARPEAQRLDALYKLPDHNISFPTTAPDEAKLSSSLYLEQMGFLPVTWTRDPFTAPFNLLGWRSGSAVQTAIPPPLTTIALPAGCVPPSNSAGKGKGKATVEHEAEKWRDDAVAGMEVPEPRPEEEATNVLIVLGFSEDIRAATFEAMARDAFFHARVRPLSGERSHYEKDEQFIMVLSRSDDVWPEQERQGNRTREAEGSSQSQDGGAGPFQTTRIETLQQTPAHSSTPARSPSPVNPPSPVHPMSPAHSMSPARSPRAFISPPRPPKIEPPTTARVVPVVVLALVIVHVLVPALILAYTAALVSAPSIVLALTTVALDILAPATVLVTARVLPRTIVTGTPALPHIDTDDRVRTRRHYRRRSRSSSRNSSPSSSGSDSRRPSTPRSRMKAKSSSTCEPTSATATNDGTLPGRQHLFAAASSTPALAAPSKFLDPEAG